MVSLPLSLVGGLVFGSSHCVVFDTWFILNFTVVMKKAKRSSPPPLPLG